MLRALRPHGCATSQQTLAASQGTTPNRLILYSAAFSPKPLAAYFRGHIWIGVHRIGQVAPGLTSGVHPFPVNPSRLELSLTPAHQQPPANPVCMELPATSAQWKQAAIIPQPQLSLPGRNHPAGKTPPQHHAKAFATASRSNPAQLPYLNPGKTSNHRTQITAQLKLRGMD